VVASESDAKSFLTKTEATQDTRVIVDKSIVGGHILTKDWKRIDDSHKTKLLTWYRRSIK